MKVRVNARTLICKHVDIKADIQYIIERRKIKMVQTSNAKKSLEGYRHSLESLALKVLY